MDNNNNNVLLSFLVSEKTTIAEKEKSFFSLHITKIKNVSVVYGTN